MEECLETLRKSHHIIVASWFGSLDLMCLVSNGRVRLVNVRILVIQFRLSPKESLEIIDLLSRAGVKRELVRFLSCQTLIQLRNDATLAEGHGNASRVVPTIVSA